MKVLILTNNDVGLYKFRKELIEELLNPGCYISGRNDKACKVFISLPDGEYIPELKKMGCVFMNTPIDRRGTNPKTDLKLLMRYRYILKKTKPDIVLGYTIKPNIYGGMACAEKNIPYICNITGLGTAIENKGMIQKITLFLYKIALKKAKYIFFQNQSNMDFFCKQNICVVKHDLLPGSGVNIKNLPFQTYPKENLKFIFVGRLMREKGIEEYLYAAKKIKEKYPDIEFHICGFCEEEYLQKIKEFQEKEIVIYHGMVSNMEEIYKEISCIVLPSYHEGMSNVLLEAAATGRPGIASRISGCKEIIEHEKSGYLFERKNKKQLCEMIEKFILLSYEEKIAMGAEARKKVEEIFDRTIIIKKYLDVIKEFVK